MNGAMISTATIFSWFPRVTRFALLSLVLTASVASAQYCTPDQCDECNLCRTNLPCCHELPDLWLINTRCAPRCSNLDHGFDCITFKRYDRECCRWVKESAESFLAEEATMPTLFYSHGNTLTHKNAMKSCWKIYCKLRCCPGSKRLVFWSWPSERVFKTEGLRVREMIKKNLRIKYVYAEYQGYYMAKLVQQMSLSQRVMMSGHSYGGITSAAALHYLGGGCLRGLTLDGGEPVMRPNLRGAVISGAFDNDMMLPGYRYGQSFVAAEKVYVTRNIKDSTLKKWPKTSWRGCRAIGVTGINARRLGEHCSKLCQHTMSEDVGSSHYLKPHLKSKRFMAALCCLSFPACHAACQQRHHPIAAVDPPMEAEVTEADIIEAEITESELTEIEIFSNDQLLSEEASLILSCEDFEPLLNRHEYGLDNPSLVPTNATLPENVGRFLGSAMSTNSLVDFVPTREPECVRGSTDALVLQPAQPRETQAETTPPQSTQPEPKPARQAKVERKTASHHSPHRLWYQTGLGLAVALTGQVYVRFSKRVATT